MSRRPKNIDDLVARMSTSEKERAAYKVKCPSCKALPGWFCVYKPQALGPYSRPDPKWGKPTKRPHSERHHAAGHSARQKQLAELQERWAALHADPVAPERKALGDLARQEHEQMRLWLLMNRRLFLEL